MRSLPILEFLLIACLAVALIVKPPPREATATPAAAPTPAARPISHPAPTTQPASVEMEGGR
jgi:hypothetical protein